MSKELFFVAMDIAPLQVLFPEIIIAAASCGLSYIDQRDPCSLLTPIRSEEDFSENWLSWIIFEPKPLTVPENP